MTEVTIQIDSGNKEATVASFVQALETAFQLPARLTQPGVEAAFDAHTKVLELLMEHTDPEKVGLPASVAAMFVFQQMEESHARSSADATRSCLAAAALHHKVGQLIGED